MRLLKVLSIIASVFVGLQTFAQSNIPSYVPSNGLVGYWPFNGNANDESGNGNHGVVNGAALTTDRNNIENSSYDFSFANAGWGTQNNEVYIPDSPLLDVDQITVSVWLFPRSYFWSGDSGNPISTILNRFQYGYSNPNGQAWSLSFDNLSVAGGILGADGTGGAGVSSNFPLTLNQWHHVSLTYNGALITLFVDGVLVNTQAYTGLMNTNGNSGISIGESNQANGFWSYADAKIDDIAIFNRALTQQEITNLYTQTPPASCLPSYVPTNGLVGYWPFCGNANDESGNGNDGVVNGAALTSDRNGNTNSAYIFSNLNDVITVSNINPLFTNIGKTISTWFKLPTQFNYSSLALVKHGTAYSNGFYLSIDQNDAAYGANNYIIAFLAGNGGSITFTTNQIELGNWVHLVATYDGSFIKLYLNGILKANQSFSGNLDCPNDLIYFGKWDNPSVPAVVSRELDDIGIWNRALSQQEITNLYNQTPPVSCLPSYVPTNGLVGYWPFCGNANDESGNGNNGVVNGATLATDRFGNSNSAYSFDGVNDFIQSPNQTLSGSVSFSGWYQMSDFNTLGNDMFYISNQSTTNDIYSSNIAFGFRSYQGQYGHSTYVASPLTGYYATNNLPTENVWHHITCVFENGSYVKMYLDNILIYSNNNVVTSLSQASLPLLFGGTGTSSFYYYLGQLDDIGIWNRALTQQEITNLYQGSSPFNIVSSATSTCAGQPVTLSVTALPGTISGLNCSSATNTGSLVAGVATSNVSSTIPYTGGNGGLQNGQTVSSTGVTGLTATLSGGVLNTGNGNLIYTITGTPSAAGTASFALNIGGQTCTLSWTVISNLVVQYPAGSVFCAAGPTAIVDVTNPITGKVWMDRNLGASQVATSSTDANAYGDLYQWGRRSDGHQCRTSTTTTTLSSVDQPSHGNFITNSTTPFDWRNPQNTNLWQGVNGVNNPCPIGYRLPSENELNNERLSWNTNNNTGSFNSVLKLPSGGYREVLGAFVSVGTIGDYWSSTLSSVDTKGLSTISSNSIIGAYYRGLAFSVRCIKEVIGTLGAINCGSATNTGTLTASTAASGVSSSVPYTGGNAGSHSGQTVTSTGVTGLTAILAAGSFANGAGALIYNITGTPSAAGTASFALNIGGQTCTLTFTVSSILAAQYPAGSVFCAAGPTAIVDVTNPVTGKTWMDRNLGASQVATSSSDANSFGDLYQWGRRSDGHQCRTSATTTALSSTDQPAHGNFITNSNSPIDWRNLQNTNLWQGVNGFNNPCPIGYRVPSQTELSNENILQPSASMSSEIKAPQGGYRSNIGTLTSTGWGYYWTNTVSGTLSKYLKIGGGPGFYDFSRSTGASVRCIKEITGTLGAINCGTATNTGTLTASTAASGVSSSIPYTGGNAGSHSGQTVTSTGVTGLTATLAAGSFANGAGALIYNITGTPSAAGTASFAINIGGQMCTLTFTVSSNLAAQYPAGSVFCAAGPTAIVDVTNPVTGKVWMDRNLGASQVATSSTDANAYGDLYQWGRGVDGHQCRNSATTTTLSSSDQPGNGNFITFTSGDYDWRSPQNNNLWQGVNGLNNPCPSGYRLPSDIELDAERLSWSVNTSAGAFASPLKLPLAGVRGNMLGAVGTDGYYWSSMISSASSYSLYFSSSLSAMLTFGRASGFSIRCVKD